MTILAYTVVLSAHDYIIRQEGNRGKGGKRHR
jgi:hypothetical protein